MKHDAIEKVTIALRDRLQAALIGSKPATPLIPGTVFVGPLDDRDSRNAPLILFLYRIAPNGDLRNSERRTPSATPPGVNVFHNSLPLDLCYLVTVGTTPRSSEEFLLRALGLAMQTLQVDPILTGPSVENETIRVTLQSLSAEESSRIWALFPNENYRTSIAYIVSPVWIDPAIPEPSAAPVMNGALRSGVMPTEVIQ